MSHDEIGRSLGRIEEAIRQLKLSMPDHEKRLRSLERWRWISAGVVGAAAFLLKLVYGK